MPNQNPECIGCPENTPKTQGGYGRTCNGYTMEEEGRCPEWRINEIRDKKAKVVKKKCRS